PSWQCIADAGPPNTVAVSGLQRTTSCCAAPGTRETFMPLGVLMLDTRFTRFVGDIGNPDSYTDPVLFEVVRGATVDKVVPAKAPPLIDDFVAAGERLVARGASAITTGCGFLVLNQAELAA